MSQRGFGSSSSRFIGNTPINTKNTNPPTKTQQPSQRSRSTSRSSFDTNINNNNNYNERSRSRSHSSHNNYQYEDDNSYNSDSSFTNDRRIRNNSVSENQQQRSTSVSRSLRTKDLVDNGNYRDNNHTTINGGIRSISRNRSVSQSGYDSNHSNTTNKQRNPLTVQQRNNLTAPSSTSTSRNNQRTTTGIKSHTSSGTGTVKSKTSSIAINKEDKLWGDIAALTSKLARIQRGDVPSSQQHTLNSVLSELSTIQQNRNNNNTSKEKLSQETLNIIAKAAAALSLQNSQSLNNSQQNNSSSSSRLSLSNLQTNNNTTTNSYYYDNNDDEDDISDASEEEGAGEAGMAAAVAELTKAEVARQLAAVGLGSSFAKTNSTASANTMNNSYLPSTGMFVHPPTTVVPYPLLSANNSTYTLFPTANSSLASSNGNFNLSQLQNYSTSMTNNSNGSNTSIMPNVSNTITPRPILSQPNPALSTNTTNGFGSPTKLGSIVQADFSMTDNSTATDISSDFDDDDDESDGSPLPNKTQLFTNNPSSVAQQRLFQMTLNGGTVLTANNNNNNPYPLSTNSPSKLPVKRRTIQSPSSPLSPISSNNNNSSRSPGRKSVTFADEQKNPSTTVLTTNSNSNPSSTTTTVPMDINIPLSNSNSTLAANTNPPLPQVIVVTQPPPAPNAVPNTNIVHNIPDPLVVSLKTEMDTMRNLLEGLMTEVVTQKVLLQQKEKQTITVTTNEGKSKSPARTPTTGTNSKETVLTEDSTMLKSLALLLSRLVKQEESNTNNSQGNTSSQSTTASSSSSRTPTTNKSATHGSSVSSSSSSLSSSTTKGKASVSPHPLELASPQLEQNSPESVRAHRTVNKVSPVNSKSTTTILKSSQISKSTNPSTASTTTVNHHRKTVSYQDDFPLASPSSSSSAGTKAEPKTSPTIVVSTERRAIYPRNVKGRVGLTVCDFEGDIAENQMSLVENERILITHEFETGWWYGYRLLTVPSTIDTEAEPGYARTSGYIPASFIDMTDEVYDSEDIILETEHGTEKSGTTQKKKSVSTPYNYQRSHPYSDEDEEDDDYEERDHRDETREDNASESAPLTSTRSGRLTAHKAAAARARLSLSLGGKNNSTALNLSEVMLASPPNNYASKANNAVSRTQPVYTVPTPSVLRASTRKPVNTTTNKNLAAFTSPVYGGTKYDHNDDISTYDLAPSTNYKSQPYANASAQISTVIKAGSNDWQTLKETYNQLRTKAVAMEASFNSTWGSSSSSNSSMLRSPLVSSLSTSSSSFLHPTVRPTHTTSSGASQSNVNTFPREMHTTRKPTLSSVVGTSFTDRAHSLATPARTPYYTSSLAPSTRPSISVGSALNGTIASLFFPPKLAHKDMATSPMPTNNDNEHFRPRKELSPMKTESRSSTIDGSNDNRTIIKSTIPAPPTSPVPILPSTVHFHTGSNATRTPTVRYYDEGVGTEDLMDSPAPPPPPQSLPPVSPRMMISSTIQTNGNERRTNTVAVPPTTETITIDDSDDDDDIPPPPPPLPEPTNTFVTTKSLQPHPPVYSRGSNRSEITTVPLTVISPQSLPVKLNTDPQPDISTVTLDSFSNNRTRSSTTTKTTGTVRSIAVESPSPTKQSPIQPRTVHTSPVPLTVPQSTSTLFIPSFVPTMSTVTTHPLSVASTVPTSSVSINNTPSVVSSIPTSTINPTTIATVNRPLLRPYSMQNVNNTNTNNLALTKPQDTPNTAPPMMTASIPSSSSSLNLPAPSSLPNTGFVVKPFLSMNSNPAPGITGPGLKQPKPMVGRTALNNNAYINNSGTNTTIISPPSPPADSLQSTSSSSIYATAQVPNAIPLLPPSNPHANTNALLPTASITVPTNAPVVNTFSSPVPPPPPQAISVAETLPSSSVAASTVSSPVPPPPASVSTASIVYPPTSNTQLISSSSSSSSSPLANLIANTVALSSPLRIGGPLPNSAIPLSSSLSRNNNNYRYSPENNNNNNNNRRIITTTSPVLFNNTNGGSTNGVVRQSSPPTFVRSPSSSSSSSSSRYTTNPVNNGNNAGNSFTVPTTAIVSGSTITRPPPPSMDPRLRMMQGSNGGPTRIT